MSGHMPFSSVSVCPYNPSHIIPTRRYFNHLSKCQLRYKHIVLKVCPFNATHRMKPDDYHQHILECPQREPIENHKYYSLNPQIYTEPGTSSTEKEDDNVSNGTVRGNIFVESFEERGVPVAGSIDASPQNVQLLLQRQHTSGSNKSIDWSKKLGMGRGNIF